MVYTPWNTSMYIVPAVTRASGAEPGPITRPWAYTGTATVHMSFHTLGRLPGKDLRPIPPCNAAHDARGLGLASLGCSLRGHLEALTTGRRHVEHLRRFTIQASLLFHESKTKQTHTKRDASRQSHRFQINPHRLSPSHVTPIPRYRLPTP